MRRIREALRLHLQAGLSYNEVGLALKISKSVVGKYVLLARVAGVDWDVAQTLDDETLEARLYRPAVPRSSHQLAPDFAGIETMHMIKKGQLRCSKGLVASDADRFYSAATRWADRLSGLRSPRSAYCDRTY